MTKPPYVVFDAFAFVRAIISGRGPAAAYIERIRLGEAVLFLTDAILKEIREVPLRPELTRRYPHLVSGPQASRTYRQSISSGGCS